VELGPGEVVGLLRARHGELDVGAGVGGVERHRPLEEELGAVEPLVGLGAQVEQPLGERLVGGEHRGLRPL
jgi:hypothetical protein